MDRTIYLPADLYKQLADFILCDGEAQRALGIESDVLSSTRNDVMIALAEHLDMFPADCRHLIEDA